MDDVACKRSGVCSWQGYDQGRKGDTAPAKQRLDFLVHIVLVQNLEGAATRFS